MTPSDEEWEDSGSENDQNYDSDERWTYAILPMTLGLGFKGQKRPLVHPYVSLGGTGILCYVDPDSGLPGFVPGARLGPPAARFGQEEESAQEGEQGHSDGCVKRQHRVDCQQASADLGAEDHSRRGGKRLRNGSGRTVIRVCQLPRLRQAREHVPVRKR